MPLKQYKSILPGLHLQNHRHHHLSIHYTNAYHSLE